MPEITPATATDIPQLCELLGILFTQEQDFTPDASKQATGLAQIIEHPETGRILVLRDGPRILGMINLLFSISTACGGRVALLEDMVVHPERRNEGLGAALLQAAIEFAKNAGCLRLTLLTDGANDAAIRFYQRRGFRVSTMIPLRLTLNRTR